MTQDSAVYDLREKSGLRNQLLASGTGYFLVPRAQKVSWSRATPAEGDDDNFSFFLMGMPAKSDGGLRSSVLPNAMAAPVRKKLAPAPGQPAEQGLRKPLGQKNAFRGPCKRKGMMQGWRRQEFCKAHIDHCGPDCASLAA